MELILLTGPEVPAPPALQHLDGRQPVREDSQGLGGRGSLKNHGYGCILSSYGHCFPPNLPQQAVALVGGVGAIPYPQANLGAQVLPGPIRPNHSSLGFLVFPLPLPVRTAWQPFLVGQHILWGHVTVCKWELL
eukprot:2669435-Rhodomonas_salina.1